ncbi:hypothetical protein BJV82DRAFT_24902 [Fennellomyces sp. T-0311]|nr:hypothetical protein BJV82DRAFT_24902 [Fennellomyces sp. T-0311]
MATHPYDNMNLMRRPPSYDGSIRESRASFEFSDSESSVASADLPQPPEKNIESRERVSTKTLLRAIMLPVFNILATIALIGVIILIYIRADGQPVDYKMAGLSVPTVLALVMTLVVLFISGGIG